MSVTVDINCGALLLANKFWFTEQNALLLRRVHSSVPVMAAVLICKPVFPGVRNLSFSSRQGIAVRGFGWMFHVKHMLELLIRVRRPHLIAWVSNCGSRVVQWDAARNQSSSLVNATPVRWKADKVAERPSDFGHHLGYVDNSQASPGQFLAVP